VNGTGPGTTDATGLPREMIRRIRRIEIRTRRLVNESMAGEYHSVFRGRGMEFSEVREYQMGDDIRTIDWNVTSRMGHPYVKKFVEERELTADEERELRQLAADLQAVDSDLDITQSGREGFWLQMGYDNERPVVIDIDGTSIVMSWSYGAADSAPALMAVVRYLPVFDRHGYLAYDPPVGPVYEPSRMLGGGTDPS